MDKVLVVMPNIAVPIQDAYPFFHAINRRSDFPTALDQCSASDPSVGTSQHCDRVMHNNHLTGGGIQSIALFKMEVSVSSPGGVSFVQGASGDDGRVRGHDPRVARGGIEVVSSLGIRVVTARA